MPIISDCYVLAPSRSSRLSQAFMDEFVPSRVSTFDPSDPVDVLGVSEGYSPSDLLSHLETNTTVSYSLYYRNTENQPPYYAILAYNNDGSLILGLSCDEDETSAREMLGRLEAFAGSFGYWGVEEAPTISQVEFEDRKKLENEST